MDVVYTTLVPTIYLLFKLTPFEVFLTNPIHNTKPTSLSELRGLRTQYAHTHTYYI